MLARLVVVAIALAAACSAPPAPTPGVDPSTPGASDTDGPTVPAPVPTTRPSASVPPSPLDPTPGIPPGLPIPPAAQRAEPEPGGDEIAAWTVAADPPLVYDFYLRALPAAGFSVHATLPGGAAAIIRFSAPDGRAYQLDLAGHDPVRIRLVPPHD